MQDDQSNLSSLDSSTRRKRIGFIVAAHLVIVVGFFAATFIWGSFK